MTSSPKMKGSFLNMYIIKTVYINSCHSFFRMGHLWTLASSRCGGAGCGGLRWETMWAILILGVGGNDMSQCA